MIMKNWRSRQWHDYSKSEKFWFIMLCIWLVVLFVMAGVDGVLEEVSTPRWVAVIWMIIALFILYKALPMCGWLYDNGNDEDDEDDEDDEGT